MCTIVFIPTSATDFILGHNRDESPARKKADPPMQILRYGQLVKAPIDGSKNGTWIYTSDHETVLLFNGALKKHIHQPPYSRSRGLIVFEVLSYPSHQAFIEHVDLKGVEPFTQILIHHQTQEIIELIWDGEKKVYHKLDWDPFIRSSVTLYPKSVHEIKKEQFRNWRTENEATDLLQFMQDESFEVPTILNHPKVRTLSTTIVQWKAKTISMDYYEYS